jgi:hypothetical protein
LLDACAQPFVGHAMLLRDNVRSAARCARLERRMFERRHQPLLARHLFLGRVRRSALAFAAIIVVSLAFGTLGYRWLASLPWIDALLNASMILTGMGPVDRMTSTGGKLFAAGYALFSGVAFLSSIGVLAAPVVHRFLHRFHLEREREG